MGLKTGAFYAKDCHCVHAVTRIVRIKFQINAYEILIDTINSVPAFAESKFKFKQSCVRFRALLTN